MSALSALLARLDLPPEYLPITMRLLLAIAVGGLIGLERSYHGRPAGFRTHTLVCLSTCVLMLVTVYETYWFPTIYQGRVTIDPTRLAQGIMTGIGFLGAGAIIKEGLSVRGLTTAASIWITAALGILVGIGFYFPVAVGTVLTLGTLSVFRWIEIRMPMQTYVYFVVRFASDAIVPEDEMRRLLASYRFTIGSLTYRLDKTEDFFEYRMVIRTNRARKVKALCAHLTTVEAIREFRISPTD
jgi:putative Mg2+ transporter-C (MgtC) family protein